MVFSVPGDARTQRPVTVDRSEQNVDVSNNKINLTGNEGVAVVTGRSLNGSKTSNGENQPGRYEVNNSKQNVSFNGNTVSVKGAGFRIQTGSIQSSN